ncbi:heme A synthase, partial [Rhizobium brockwellii]
MAVANLTTEKAILSEMRKQNRDRRALRFWLGFVLLALFCLVLVGG